MKKFFKVLWWIIILPILVIILYNLLGFFILHSLNWANLQISTVMSLSSPYVFIGMIVLGIWKIKNKN